MAELEYQAFRHQLKLIINEHEVGVANGLPVVVVRMADGAASHTAAYEEAIDTGILHGEGKEWYLSPSEISWLERQRPWVTQALTSGSWGPSFGKGVCCGS